MDSAVIRDAGRNYRKTNALTKDIAERSAELSSKGYQAWVKARQESDFALFAPMLEQWVDLLKEKCHLIDASRPVYDVCLDDYERGLTAPRLDKVFSEVKEGLLPLLHDIRERGTAPDKSWLAGEYDVKLQAQMCEEIAKDLGFSTERGRLDVSVHPFTGGAHPNDVRMTTRFDPACLTEGLTGAVHETGHALYEQGRNLEYDGLPVNEALSMGIHESQSLLWERMVCLQPAFSKYLLPRMRSLFPDDIPASATAQQLYEALNVVRTPSLIRVESDEVTYPMHIILRYEIERALMEGRVEIKDLPEVWNEKMQSYLGCTPQTAAEGVLQDVHWSVGAIGYFPTYSLGAMYACQIYEAANKELALDEQIAQGSFGSLKEWLNAKVHTTGSLYPSGDLLMEQVTGAPLNPSIFLKYLNDKYRPLYKL
uniref:Carboxypeptidase n=1 Tax=Pyramimonas obovata TaxID=1411642 RepID=A0A7S0WIZ3_9CHLO